MGEGILIRIILGKKPDEKSGKHKFYYIMTLK